VPSERKVAAVWEVKDKSGRRDCEECWPFSIEVSHASRRSVDHPGARDFVQGFTSGIIDTRIGSATLAVLRCTMLCRSTLDSKTADRAVQVLLEDLADFGRKFNVSVRYFGAR
jgi:hypothetical protein